MEGTPEEQRVEGLVTEVEYQRLKTWQRICNLTTMEETKCLACPLSRRVVLKSPHPVMVDSHGTEFPVPTDIGTMMTFRRHRGGSQAGRPGVAGERKLAAWTQHDEPVEGEPTGG